MSELLDTKVGKIKDAQILALIRELDEACSVGSHYFVNMSLLTFLTQCVYPRGPQKRIPITTRFAASTSLLETRVGKLPDGPLRHLCGELALLSGTALEFFHGNKVYVLLNKTLPKNLTIEERTDTQKRWDAVVRRRRSNRG